MAVEYRRLGDSGLLVSNLPYGPFGSAQRDRTASGPEALGALVQAHAKGDHDGIHPAR